MYKTLHGQCTVNYKTWNADKQWLD